MPTTNNTNNGAKTDWKKNELGALWKRQSKGSGEKYLTGTLKFQESVQAGQEIQVIIFSNKTKKADSHPDLRVYISEKPGNAVPAPVQTKVVAKTLPVKAPVAVEVADDSQELL